MKIKFLTDVILNIFASALPIFTLQFILLPEVASEIEASTYGYIITIVSWMNFSAFTLGNVLNNSRLIYNTKYDDANIKGDFNVLLIVFFIINIGVMSLGIIYYDRSFDTVNLIFLILASSFVLIKGYAIVEFRIKLNYKKILLESICSVLGYCIGYFFFLYTGYWQFIYLFGAVCGCAYVMMNTTILKEPYRKTSIFRNTKLRTYALLGAGFLNASTVYIDKLLLFPLLGGMAVSIYFTSTILGKTIALVLGPITSVFLSYISRLKKIENQSLIMLLIISTTVGLAGYVSVILVSKPILTFLYPQFVDDSIKYIYITTAAMIITIICNIFNAVLLKFCDMKWQLAINAIYLVVYVVLSLILLDHYGLIGFCVGILLANILKLFLMIGVYFLLDENNKENKTMVSESNI